MNMTRLDNVKAIIQRRFSGNQSDFGRAIERSPSQVHNWLAGYRSIGEKVARSIEQSLGLPIGWLDAEHQPDESGANHETSAKIVATPKNVYNINYALGLMSELPVFAACNLAEWMTKRDLGKASEVKRMDTSGLTLSKNAFVTQQSDDSMEPEIQKGDTLIIDPELPPIPGCYVVAYAHVDGIAVCRRYSVPRYDEDGKPVVELLPLDRAHYPVLTADKTPFTIAGRLVRKTRTESKDYI